MTKEKRPAIVKSQWQFYSIKFFSVFKKIALSPTAVIHSRCYRVAVSRCSQYIHDQTFVKSSYREIHGPVVIGTPMPIQNLFTTLCKPVPFNIIPKPANAVA